MAVQVIMPQMGESVAEGTLVQWLKSVGDAVAVDEPIFEITTDKVDAEIPSPVAGVLLEIKVQAGETVAVETVVALIGEAGERVEATAPEPSPELAAAPVGDAAPPASACRAETSAAKLRRTRSTPVVRRIAAEHDVRIDQVTGTGLDGRVTRKDILAFIDARDAVAPAPAGKIDLGVPRIAVAATPADRVESMSPMRRTISDRMIASKRYSAHVHTCFEVDYTRVNALRRRFKPTYAERGARLTFTSFIAKAAIDALRVYPVLNSAHDGERVTFRGDINLGIAVALDWGLLVPVIRQADRQSMLGLSQAIADLGERARTKKLRPEEVSGLTFSITNPGVFGSQWGTPIIPQPTTAILGVGTIEKRVKVQMLDDGGDAMVIRTCGYLTLGFDHRVIDGAVADQFMGHLKRTLETFDASAM